MNGLSLRSRRALGILILASIALLRTWASDPVEVALKRDGLRLAQPFSPAEVRLLDGPFLKAQRRNERYLLSLDPERLLATFRLNVGMASPAQPYGGWEDSKVEVRGHSLGHYLTALSLAYASTGNAQFKQRVDFIVAELARCQAAAQEAGFSPGYLSAFPESFIERVETGQPVWAPWYTLHKIMAGLLDSYLLCGNSEALEILKRQANWVGKRVSRLTTAQMQASLENESGGMNEALANLYAVTGDTEHLKLAHAFDHERIFAPLARGEDRLDGLHANTQIAKMIGAAREYELTGDTRYRDIARSFWESVAMRRSYAIGGHSDAEHFFPPEEFSQHLTTDTTETCNTYNMLKLTQAVWSWEPSARAMDFYERALFNHILASQDPDNGMYVYLMSLKPGHFKTYSLPNDSFWCCVGTGMENSGRYASAIYAHDGRDTLFVNQFIASELKAGNFGFTLRQETRFPEEENVRLTLRCDSPVRGSLKIRYPAWAAADASLKINGVRQPIAEKPGSYLTLRREWRDGDRVELRLPMSLHAETMPDNSSVVALLYGPVVLAGKLGRDGMPQPYARGQLDLNGVASPEVPVFVSASTNWLKQVRRAKSPGSGADCRLARRILEDTDMDFALDHARALLGSGLTAGSGYGEVWIRDLNTFIEMALRFSNRDAIRSNLLTFFKFQGADGDIPDGFIPAAKATVGYKYRRSELAPGLLAHKNTVETDQESSLVQAVRRYIQATGDRGILAENVGGKTVRQRLGLALDYLMNHRFDATNGLIWGATTVDWGDVQPEHQWGVELDATSHLTLDIYDNAMLLVAIADYLEFVGDNAAEQTRWRAIDQRLRANVRRHLWDSKRRQFTPHLYLNGSPFPADFDERAIYYHGGTAVAIEAGLLSGKEIQASLARMRENVRLAGAGSIGLTIYPPYPDGLFKNASMKAWSYQNGGDWCWFGGRMVQQLIRAGRIADAYAELKPMIARVAKHGDFHEWWSRDNQPRGSAQFRGSAGVLGLAILQLRDWARQQDEPLTFRTRGLGRPEDVTLVPFYRLHHERYSVYWRVMTPAQFRQREVEAAEAKARAADLNRRTLDVVQIGDQASEGAHGLAGDNTQTGTHRERRWRHARGWFRYEVEVDANRPTQLLCTWWGSDAGGREFDIVVDGRVVATEQLESSRPGEFFDRTYDLPTDLTRGKSRVEVKFQARPGQTAGGLFGLRVIRAD